MQEHETDKYKSLRQIGIKKTTKVGSRSIFMKNPKVISIKKSRSKVKGCSGCSRKGNR